jgi:hydrogenase expression/formation protein HypE
MSGTSAGEERGLNCPVPFEPGDKITLAHGSGGRLSTELIRDLFLPLLSTDGSELARLGDAAVVDVEGVRLAFTTDAFVVKPAFFPGSNIGELAVNGTVNDLAMMGARPTFLSAAFVIEEGFGKAELAQVVSTMGAACKRAGVALVAGDTKVVERGCADDLYITTSGIGVIAPGIEVGPERARPGDRVIVTAPIGTHGVAVMSRREGISFETALASDTAPLTTLAQAMIDAGEVRCLRDATRGGVAAVLNELAVSSAVSITLDEDLVPVLEAVRAACEMLGLDPLYVANEGVAVAIVAPQDAEAILEAAGDDPYGHRSALVGEVREGTPHVGLRTSLGVTRPIPMLTGEQLPRIC